MSLAGKTLFITGASRGIGLAIALKAARDGANIAVAAKTAEPHKHLPGTIYTAAEEIEAAGGKALPLIVDVRDEASVYEGVERCVAAFGAPGAIGPPWARPWACSRRATWLPCPLPIARVPGCR